MANEAVTKKNISTTMFNDPQHTILSTDKKRAMPSDSHSPLLASGKEDIPSTTTQPLRQLITILFNANASLPLTAPLLNSRYQDLLRAGLATHYLLQWRFCFHLLVKSLPWPPPHPVQHTD